MRSRSPSADAVNLFKCGDERINAMLDKLDGEASPNHHPNARTARRYRLRIRNCLVMIQQPGSAAPITHVVPVRDISTSGFAFLYRGYVYPDSVCSLRLESPEGPAQTVSGTVAHCQYLESMIHLVGVRFNERADLTGLSAMLEPVCTVIYSEDGDLAASVAEKLAGDLIDAVTVLTAEDLESCLRTQEVDVLLASPFDLREDVIERVRSAGFKRAIAGLGAVSKVETGLFSLVIDDLDTSDLSAQVISAARS